MDNGTLKELVGQVDVEYYNLEGKELHMLLPPGDLVKICNVLHDYSDLLNIFIEDYKDDIEQTVTVATCKVYYKRLKKIQSKIEETIGYSTSAAIEKCRKKALKQKDDIDVGEDALVLALKARKMKNNSSQKKSQDNVPKKGNKSDVEKNQMSLFDFMK